MVAIQSGKTSRKTNLIYSVLLGSCPTETAEEYYFGKSTQATAGVKIKLLKLSISKIDWNSIKTFLENEYLIDSVEHFY